MQDGFEGSERADSIMLVNVAPNGQAVALSIPRDTYAEIPGVGWDKINASYAYGGPQLLVETVEKLTGLTVDHFVQIGMGAVPDMVDAVGGVELCYDHDSNDEYSGLNWTAGCHTVDGPTALQFSRMRYQDPEGDIGRTKRQRQVISKVVSEAASPATLINPARTLRVERAGSKSFTVDEDSSIMTVASLVMALRSASSDELMGVPPIESLDYTTSAGASAVLLRDETAPTSSPSCAPASSRPRISTRSADVLRRTRAQNKPRPRSLTQGTRPRPCQALKRPQAAGYRDGSRTRLPAFPGGGEDLVETVVGLPAQVDADGQRVTDELGRIAGAALEDLDGEVPADDAAQAVDDLLGRRCPGRYRRCRCGGRAGAPRRGRRGPRCGPRPGP